MNVCVKTTQKLKAQMKRWAHIKESKSDKKIQLKSTSPELLHNEDKNFNSLKALTINSQLITFSKKTLFHGAYLH